MLFRGFLGIKTKFINKIFLKVSSYLTRFISLQTKNKKFYLSKINKSVNLKKKNSHRTTSNEEEVGDQRSQWSGRWADWDVQEVYYVTIGKKSGETQPLRAEVRVIAG